MEKKPHVHAATIIEWANGAQIEYRAPDSDKWKPADLPAWIADYCYRVKPVIVYPVTHLSAEDFKKICAPYEKFYWPVASANAALRHAIDIGQVVTREEFSRAIGERAARDLAVSMAVRDKCRDLTVKHAMRSGVVHDIERLDLFTIIDAVNG